jgi:hypothetical protein
MTNIIDVENKALCDIIESQFNKLEIILASIWSCSKTLMHEEWIIWGKRTIINPLEKLRIFICSHIMNDIHMKIVNYKYHLKLWVVSKHNYIWPSLFDYCEVLQYFNPFDKKNHWNVHGSHLLSLLWNMLTLVRVVSCKSPPLSFVEQYPFSIGQVFC